MDKPEEVLHLDKIQSLIIMQQPRTWLIWPLCPLVNIDNHDACGVLVDDGNGRPWVYTGEQVLVISGPLSLEINSPVTTYPTWNDLLNAGWRCV